MFCFSCCFFLFSVKFVCLGIFYLQHIVHQWEFIILADESENICFSTKTQQVRFMSHTRRKGLREEDCF